MTTIRLRLFSQRKNVSSDYSVLKARPSKKYWTVTQKRVILIQSDRSVSMTVRSHLFPFRTQKLSSLVPKIVSWKRLVKIGSRRLEQEALREISGLFCCVCRITEKFFVESAAGGMLDRTIASAYIESVIDGKGRMGGV